MKTQTNFKDWINQIILVGQKSKYISCSKIYLFTVTHLIILIMTYKLVTLIADSYGDYTPSSLVKVAIPTGLSWYLFFKAGKGLTEKTLGILTLVYAYLSLIVLLLVNFNSIIKFVYSRKE